MHEPGTGEWRFFSQRSLPIIAPGESTHLREGRHHLLPDRIISIVRVDQKKGNEIRSDVHRNKLGCRSAFLTIGKGITFSNSVGY